MSQLPQIVMTGARVVRDPELRFAATGTPVAKIRCVATGRRFNKDTQEWEDGDKFWVDVTAFKRLAENVAESITQGALINVVGRIKTDEWEGQDGSKKSASVIIADSIALALDFDAAKVMKTERRQPSSEPSSDPWASAGGGSEAEPPF
jgi:single-strand DNA-binding protein